MYDLLVWWYQFVLRFFALVLWRILSTNNETTSILYRPNEVQKLDIGLSLEAVFVHKNDSLYYKLRYNVVSLATLAQWHWVKKVGGLEVAIFRQTATNVGKIVGAQRFHFPFCHKMLPKWKKIAKNSPKWAKVARKLRSVAKISRLHENAKVALRNIAIFWGTIIYTYFHWSHILLFVTLGT